MKDTLKFFQIAKPNPTKDDAQVQLGVHVEEILEMFTDGLLFPSEAVLPEQLAFCAQHYKAKQEKEFIEDMNRVALLDSLCDQYVTLIGTARALGMDIEGAIKEVEASNLSKFIHVGNRELDNIDFTKFEQQCTRILLEGRYKGVHWKRVGEYIVFYDGNGKILKSPSTYFEPNLEKYV